MVGFDGLCRRARWLIGAVVFAAAFLGASAGAASAADRPVSCRVYTGVRVALASGAPAEYSIDGELCATPAELTNGETVQLLIHGASYNHTYWDFGRFDGIRYSYARDLAAAGYPTFAIDEVGTVETNPLAPSADVTLSTVAYVAHEAVQDLLAGEIAGIHFGKVIEVGHSQGSYTAWVEAGTYHDVAGVIITGAVHDTTTFIENTLLGDLYPAVDDPRFNTSGLDSGYLTTKPGTRGTVFYNLADSDPNVIARDEATKDVVSGALTSSDVGLPPTFTQQISAPVLVIMGGDDRLFCGPETDGATFGCDSGQDVASEEAPYYSAQAELKACVVPGAGHDINLALNHVVEEIDALAWSAENVGQLGKPRLLGRALPPDCSN